MTGSEIKITFLGTGSAVPDIDRNQSSFALRHKGGLVLFDCGEGTQYALRKYKVSTRKEFVIWISHLHSDHFLGIPGLLASFELLGREEPVTIVGPKNIYQMIKNLLLANFIRTSYNLKVVELKSGEIFVGNGYKLRTIRAKHGNHALSVLWEEDKIPGKVNIKKLKELGVPPGPHIGELQQGQVINYEGREIRPKDIIGEDRRGRIVFYSGDTEYNENLIDFVNECDLFVHEACYPSDMEELAKERQHSTISQVAILSAKIQPQRAIMTHISPRVQNYKNELKNAKSIYNNIEFAKDGMLVEIPYLYSE